MLPSPQNFAESFVIPLEFYVSAVNISRSYQNLFRPYYKPFKKF